MHTMKNTPPRATSRHAQSLLTGIATLGLLLAPSVHADDYYWGGNTSLGDVAANTSWQDSNLWFDDSAGTIGAGAVPGASDHAIFSINSLNGTTLKPRIFADTTVNAITFKNTTFFELLGGNANRLLHVGSGGVTLDSGAAGVNIGTSTANRNVFVRFAANQTWTNNSNSLLRIRNDKGAASDNAGAVVVTMNAAGSGNISSDGGYADGINSTLGIIVDSTGTGSINLGGSSHSGGTTIKRGIMQTSNTIGTAAVQLGDTSGSATATLRINSTAGVTTDLVVAAGNTGVNTLEFIQSSGTYDANITLNNDLNVGVRSATATGAIINGDISGTGDLIKGQYQGGNSQVLTLAGANTYTGDTLITNGGFTLAETGGLTFSIGADGVNNQVAGTSGGAILFGGVFSFVFDGEAFADGNSWVIVDKSGLTNTSFAATFSVSGFDEVDDIWTNASGFTFSEDTGVLSYAAVPESSTYAALAGLGALGFVASRRRRSV